ncbi:hypothetical protein APSETT445_006326 [Aspergillus pseudonomiae]
MAQVLRRYVAPAETARHIATILGFPSKISIAAEYYEDACKDIASLASAISAFERVRLYTRPEDIPKAQTLVTKSIAKFNGTDSNISIIPFSTNHLWVRDTGPVYVYGTGAHSKERFAVNFRFSEWGKKDDIDDHYRATDGLDWPIMGPDQIKENAAFAQNVIASDVSPAPVAKVESKVCLEGGALVLDGDGTLLVTESSVLNENRNPGLSRADIEEELQRLLGVEKIIWFPGRRDLDVTDVHADAELNFVRPGVVVLSKPHPSVPKPWQDVHDEIRDILDRTVDAKGRRFEVHIVDEPDPTIFGSSSYPDPATNYVNFYFVNGGLILPQFGDPVADSAAVSTLQKLCPEHKVTPVPVRALPLAGGVVHCSTQPVVAVGEQ